jgi:hydrogenase maturation protease
LNKRRLIIGLGNILLKDEGVGVKCVEYLKGKPLDEDVKLVDGATLGFDLLEEIEGFEKVVIVDAVDMGKEPGFVASFRAEEVLSLPGSKKFSLHEIGLAEILQVGSQIGYDFSRATIVGIQPREILRGENLSPEVEARLPDLADKVLEEIGKKE